MQSPLDRLAVMETAEAENLRPRECYFSSLMTADMTPLDTDGCLGKTIYKFTILAIPFCLGHSKSLGYLTQSFT